MNDRRPSRPRWQVDAMLVLALFVSVFCLSTFSGIQEFNRRLTDGYYRLPTAHQPSDVVVVAIDDASLQEYGRWPWSRTVMAQLVRTISSAKPRVIGIDVLFSEAQTENADKELGDAIAQSGRVVLVDKIGSFPDGPRWMEPLPRFERVALAVGHAQAVLDADGICRSFPPEELSIAGPRYAFSIEMARLVDSQRTNAFLSRYGLRYAESDASVLTAKPTLLPISYEDGGIARISAARVLSGKDREQLRDKTVLVGFGPVEIGDRLTTPLSRGLPTPGVEIMRKL